MADGEVYEVSEVREPNAEHSDLSLVSATGRFCKGDSRQAELSEEVVETEEVVEVTTATSTVTAPGNPIDAFLNKK